MDSIGRLGLLWLAALATMALTSAPAWAEPTESPSPAAVLLPYEPTTSAQPTIKDPSLFPMSDFGIALSGVIACGGLFVTAYVLVATRRQLGG